MAISSEFQVFISHDTRAQALSSTLTLIFYHFSGYLFPLIIRSASSIADLQSVLLIGSNFNFISGKEGVK